MGDSKLADLKFLILFLNKPQQISRWMWPVRGSKLANLMGQFDRWL